MRPHLLLTLPMQAPALEAALDACNLVLANLAAHFAGQNLPTAVV